MVNGVVRIIVARGGDFIAFVRAEHGNARIVERLIKRFVFIVEHQRGKSPNMINATEQSRIVKIRRIGFDFKPETPILNACRKGNFERIKRVFSDRIPFSEFSFRRCFQNILFRLLP